MNHNWNKCLPLHPTDDGGVSFSIQDEGLYTNSMGMPFKTAEEFEKHYYMLGNMSMAHMWAIADDLDTALSVASRLDE